MGSIDTAIENCETEINPPSSFLITETSLSLSQKLAWYRQLFRAEWMRKRKNETALLAPQILEGRPIIDVGANHGWFSKEFASIYNGSCPVHCFEPLTYNFSILERVMSSYPNSTISKLALSDTEGEARLLVPLKANGRISPSLPHLGGEEKRKHFAEKVRITTLDNYLRKQNVEGVQFIKADIEGSELLFLQGALQTLQNDRPTLLLEINPDYLGRQGHNPKTLFEFLSQIGYRSSLMDWKGKRIVDTPSYFGPSDYLFRHESRRL